MQLKTLLLKIIDEMSENQVKRILDFAEFIKVKEVKSLFKDLTKASGSSLDFGDNYTDR